MFVITPVLLAHTIGLADILGGKILFEGSKPPQFKVEIAAWLGELVELLDLEQIEHPLVQDQFMVEPQ